MNSNTAFYWGRLRQVNGLLAMSVIAILLIAGCVPPANPGQTEVVTSAQTATMPMDHSGHAMAASDTMSHTMPMTATMPMDHSGHAMAATGVMSHTMPMEMCQSGACADEMSAMHSMMQQMKTATPEDHARMMQDMTNMMQGMMDGMDEMGMTACARKLHAANQWQPCTASCSR